LIRIHGKQILNCVTGVFSDLGCPGKEFKFTSGDSFANHSQQSQ